MYRIENTIKREVNKACKRLNLPDIEVKFNSYGSIAFSVNKLNNNIVHITIDIHEVLEDIKIHNEDYTAHLYQLRSISKRIKFIMYHEVGHYLQKNKYTKWFNKQRINYRYENISNEEYRKQPIEDKADRIALYLVNKGI